MGMAVAEQADDPEVIIVGAGPTGLALACDLARRQIRFLILDKSAEPFTGSRGKGVQPRTQEVFDDLGVIGALLAAGAPYPRMKAHLWLFSLKWRMHKAVQATLDVPYPNILLVPQWRTEQVLRDRLEALGGRVLQGAEIIGLTQDDSGVTLQLNDAGESRVLRARYVVAADGGRSFVRKSLGVGFAGTTTDEGRMIVGDLQVDGLSRDFWHVWPTASAGPIALCPLPHSDLFQLMMPLRASEEPPYLSEQTIQARWIAATGLKKIRLHDPAWLSLFRPNVRLVDRYRVGRVFLAGDAAHVHTPAGAQGLNTGIQDAYNLAWKLALVLKGAPDRLLDTYQEERLPIAAAVLGLSTQLYQSYQSGVMPSLKRGDTERQLLLNYRGSSLATEVGTAAEGLRAGDRAPDGIGEGRSGRVRLFDLYRGTHFTLLAFGARAIADVREMNRANLQIFAVRHEAPVADERALADTNGNIHESYGVRDDDHVVFLVRPDGYIGLVARKSWKEAVQTYFTLIFG